MPTDQPAATPRGSLTGPVVVLGATGTIGSALTARLADDGIPVAAVGRSHDKLDALRGPLVTTYSVDLTDITATDEVARAVATAQPTAAIAALGGWYVEEETVNLPQHRWDGTIAQNLTTHFVAARCFAPALSGTRPAYAAMNGIASHVPCVGSVAISVTGAGQRMLLDVLAAEDIGRRVAFCELVVDAPIMLPGQLHDKDESTRSIDEVYGALRGLIATAYPSPTVNRRCIG